MGTVAGRLGRIARAVPPAPTGPSFPINELPAADTGPLLRASPGGPADPFLEEVEETVDESVLEWIAEDGRRLELLKLQRRIERSEADDFFDDE